MEQTDNKWFEYGLYDAFYRPLASVTILNTNRNLILYGTYKDRRFERRELGLNSIHSVRVSDNTIKQIATVLKKNNGVFELNKLESAPDMIVIDGYLHRFYFSDGDKKVELTGDNLKYCEGEYQQCPNAALVIDVLRAIGNVLIPEGIDADCFALSIE